MIPIGYRHQGSYLGDKRGTWKVYCWLKRFKGSRQYLNVYNTFVNENPMRNPVMLSPDRFMMGGMTMNSNVESWPIAAGLMTDLLDGTLGISWAPLNVQWVSSGLSKVTGQSFF
jgi:hypothetical protein